MSRVGVLFPERVRDPTYRNVRMPYERAQTDADINDERPVNIFERKNPAPRRIMTKEQRWAQYKMRNPRPKQSDLEFKQPAPINIPYNALESEMPVIPYADKVLTARFVRDRMRTEGMLNSKQLDRAMQHKKRKLAGRRRVDNLAIDFNPMPDVLAANYNAAF